MQIFKTFLCDLFVNGVVFDVNFDVFHWMLALMSRWIRSDCTEMNKNLELSRDVLENGTFKEFLMNSTRSCNYLLSVSEIHDIIAVKIDEIHIFIQSFVWLFIRFFFISDFVRLFICFSACDYYFPPSAIQLEAFFLNLIVLRWIFPAHRTSVFSNIVFKQDQQKKLVKTTFSVLISPSMSLFSSKVKIIKIIQC